MKFTIVMTVYKREELFLHALYTVLQQDYTDWELIILADGPHPDTEAAVELITNDRYHAFWDRPNLPGRIQYHSCKRAPEGTVGNPLRRRGLKLATGDYVCFTGHDCLLDKDYLSTHKANIEKADCDCVSVVSALYWTDNTPYLNWIREAGGPAAAQGGIPTFIGKIPWSFTGQIDLQKSVMGELDLTCFCFPVSESKQVGVFSKDMDYAYDADFQSFAKLRDVVPVVFNPKVAAGHF